MLTATESLSSTEAAPRHVGASSESSQPGPGRRAPNGLGTRPRLPCAAAYEFEWQFPARPPMAGN